MFFKNAKKTKEQTNKQNNNSSSGQEVINQVSVVEY